MMGLGILGLLGFLISLVFIAVSAVKKNGKIKKWGIGAVACFVLFIIGVSSSPSNNTASNNAAVTSVNSYASSGTSTAIDKTTRSVSAGISTAATAVQEEKKQYITDGMYKVGSDLKAGEYILYGDGLMSYFEISKDSSGTLDSIIANDTFSGTRYVTLKDGQYFELKGAKMLAAADADVQGPADGKYEAGMYKVGRDIKAGEYKVIPDGSSASYVEVSKNSLHTLDSIVTNDILSGEKYLTVKDGQYIKLVNCYIKTK